MKTLRSTPDDPCAYRDGCDAYKATATQAADLATAAIVVTVHQLAVTAHAWLAEQPDGALAVVDEAPELLDARRYTAAEITAAAAAVSSQKSAVLRSEAWRGPMLAALAAGLAVVGDTCSSITDAIVAGLAVTELLADETARRTTVAGWAARCARWDAPTGEAQGRKRDRYAPRPARRVMRGLRQWRHETEALAAIGVCGIVARALACELAAAAKVTVAVGTREYGDHKGARELRLTAVVEPLAELLADVRFGRVILSATPDVRLLEPFVGEVAIEQLAVRDGAHIDRLFVPWSHATRRHCLTADREPVWSEIAGPLCEGIALAAEGLERGAKVAVITFRAVVNALDKAQSEPDTAPPEIAKKLAELRLRGIALVTGYYGATRGRNDWRDCNALLAVGTPWPDLSSIEQMCSAHPDLAGASRDVARYMARAELEQAVGRLRAPRRTTAGRIVVVASEAPLRADTRWSVRELAASRPAEHNPAALAELAVTVGRNEAARIAGVSPRTVSRAVSVHVGHDGVGHNPLIGGTVLATGYAPPHRGVGGVLSRLSSEGSEGLEYTPPEILSDRAPHPGVETFWCIAGVRSRRARARGWHIEPKRSEQMQA